MRVRKMNQVDVKLHDLTKVKLKTAGNMQIPAHPTTHSAKNWSAFPDVTEHISASADQ